MVDIFNNLSSLLCPYFNAKVAFSSLVCRRTPAFARMSDVCGVSGRLVARGLDESPQNFNDGLCRQHVFLHGRGASAFLLLSGRLLHLHLHLHLHHHLNLHLNLHHDYHHRHLYFSQVGLVKKVIMGLNRFTFRPAGFCFVECANCRLQFCISGLHLTPSQILPEAARHRRRVLLQRCNA